MIRSRSHRQVSRQVAHQVTAFGLAAVLTFGLLGSINVLAVQPAAEVMAAHGVVKTATAHSSVSVRAQG